MLVLGHKLLTPLGSTNGLAAMQESELLHLTEMFSEQIRRKIDIILNPSNFRSPLGLFVLDYRA